MFFLLFKGLNTAQTVQWVVDATNAARNILGPNAIITHAPQTPYFGTSPHPSILSLLSTSLPPSLFLLSLSLSLSCLPLPVLLLLFSNNIGVNHGWADGYTQIYKVGSSFTSCYFSTYIHFILFTILFFCFYSFLYRKRQASTSCLFSSTTTTTGSPPTPPYSRATTAAQSPRSTGISPLSLSSLSSLSSLPSLSVPSLPSLSLLLIPYFRGGVPLNKIVIGKPVRPSDGNGYVSPATLHSYFIQAQSRILSLSYTFLSSSPPLLLSSPTSPSSSY